MSERSGAKSSAVVCGRKSVVACRVRPAGIYRLGEGEALIGRDSRCEELLTRREQFESAIFKRTGGGSRPSFATMRTRGQVRY